MKELQLNQTKTVVTPAVHESRKARNREGDLMNKSGVVGESRRQARKPRYSAMVVGCNFSGYDLPNIQYPAKGASRWVPKPCKDEHANIVRIGKSLDVASAA